MDGFLKVLGVIALIWIIFVVFGAIFKFLVGAFLWIAIILGVVFLISWVAAKGKQIGSR